MNPGASQSLEIFFTPNYAVLIESELIVEFSQGGKVYIAIKGTGENSDVSLSTPSLAMEPSFISLLSQRSLRIKNMGSQSIRYTWKSYSTAGDEENEKERLLFEINRMEGIERAALEENIG
jgi:hypothetical protein